LTAAGADMVMTFEPHTEAIVGCYEPRLCVLESIGVCRPFARFLKGIGWTPDCVASTDVGGLERARQFAQVLECDLVALSKERDYTSQSTVTRTTVVGDVAGRSVLLVDDIVDTGGSVVAAVDALWAAGATDISVAGVHMVLSDPAWERLAALNTEASERGHTFRLAGTNTVRHRSPGLPMAVFELDDLIASAIQRINTRGSVRALE